MNPDDYGLVEMALSFGALLVFLIWQLIVTRRGVKADRERAAREKAGRE
jgi:hypothetical protein